MLKIDFWKANSLDQTRVPIVPKVALLTSNNAVFSKPLMISMLVLYQFQILLIAMKPAVLSIKRQEPTFSEIFDNFYSVLYWEDNKILGSSDTIIWMLGFTGAYMLLNFFLLYYMKEVLKRNRKPFDGIQKLFSALVSIHHYLLFYPIHISCIKVLFTLFEGDEQEIILVTEEYEKYVKIICIIIVVFNTIWSILFTFLLKFNVKTKNPLSNKTAHLDLLDLAFVIIMPIAETFMASETSTVTLLTSTLVYTLFRDCMLFHFLPYYKLSTLKTSTMLHAVVTSFCLTAVISRPISHARSYTESALLFPMWLLFVIVIEKLYRRHMDSLLLGILKNPNKITNPYHVLHFLLIYKFFSKNPLVGCKTAKANENYLHYMGIIKQSEVADLIPLKPDQKLHFPAQEIIDKHFLKLSIDLLNKSIRRNPELLLLKATLAYYYAKYQKLDILANQVLEDNLSSSISQKNSYCLIKAFILEKIKERNQKKDVEDTDDSDNGVLALAKYTQVQQIFIDLKKEIIQQLKLQTQFWKRFQSSDSEFVSLANLAKRIFKKSKHIKKTSLNYKVFCQLDFIEPVLVYSLYFYFVQNDLKTGQKFLEEYYRLEARFDDHLIRKAFKIHDLRDSLYFLLSTSGDQPGTILNCSGQVNTILGMPKQMLIQNQLGILMPHVYARWFDEYLKSLVQNSKSEIVNDIVEVPILVKNGFIASYWIYLKLIYQSEFGLCYSGLLGPLHDNKRLIIVTGDGQICGISKDLSNDLNIMNIARENKKKFESIFYFCPQLEGILEDMKISNSEGLQNKINSQNKTYEKFRTYAFNNNLKEEGNIDDKHSSDNFVKDVYLAFYTIITKQGKLKRMKSMRDNKKYLVYKTQIKMRVVLDIFLFEIKMEKTENKSYLRETIKEKSLSDNSPKHIENSEYRVHSSGNEGKRNEEGFQSEESLIVSPKLENLKKSNFFKNDSKNEEAGLESSEQTSPMIIKFKKENNDFTTKYMPTIDSGGDTPTHDFVLASPKSEKKKLIQLEKREINDSENFEIYSHDKRLLEEDEQSLPFSKERRKKRHQTTLKLKKLETNVLKEALGKNKPGHQSFGNAQEIDIHKYIRKFIVSRKYQRSSIAYIMCFIASMCVLMIFLIWLNFNTSETSTMIGDLSQVIQSAYFRNFWGKITIYDMMFWLGVRHSWIEYDIVILQETVLKDIYKITAFNQNLITHLSVLDNEIQKPFYEKEVDVYERDNMNNLLLVTKEDTFAVYKMIVNYGFKNSYKPNIQFPDTEPIDTDSRFMVDNLLNTLMIVSEKLIAYMESKQLETINNSKHLMIMTFSCTLAFLILFVLVSLIYVIYINKDFNTFVSILSTLPVHEIVQTEGSLSMFLELLEKDSSSIELLDAFDPGSQEKVKYYKKNMHPQHAKASRKTIDKPSMRTFYTRNYLVFFGLFVCLGLMTGFMIIYYQLALNNILVMERQHTNLNSALNILNSFALVVPGLEVLTLTNGTTTIKNIPILKYMKSISDTISTVNDFQANLRDSSGEFSPIQMEILFSYSCTKASSPLWLWPLEVMQPECEFISDGLNFVGLFKLITQLVKKLNSFLEIFESRPKDLQSLKTRLAEVLEMSFTTDIGNILLLQLFTDSTNRFHELVVKLEAQRVLLAWIACLVSIALGTLTWIFIVKKLSRREFEKKKILALIPNKLIFENFLLKKYVSQLK